MVEGVPSTDLADEGRRRATQELVDFERVFRSFRLHADGSLYAEAEPWTFDESALLDSARQGSISDEEVLRRRERHLLLEQQRKQARRQQQSERPHQAAVQQDVEQLQRDPGGNDPGLGEDQWQAHPATPAGRAAGRRRGARALLQYEDNRYNITDTGYWPNNAVVQMYYLTNGTTTPPYTTCSGTWVSGYDVLTAAHCVYNWDKSTAYASYVIRPAMFGTTWNGTYKAVFTTWYRSEWSSSNYASNVNYFDIAMIRVDASGAASTLPYPSYLGYKYDCDQTIYSASTCGYPNDRRFGNTSTSEAGATASYFQTCCDFTFPGTRCQADFQPWTACLSYPGASGSSVFDLLDYKAIGVISARLTDSSYSKWTPITAQHFAALERWRYQGGADTKASVPPSPPNLPPPPPYNALRYACTTSGAVRLVSSGTTSGAGRVEICAADIGGKLWWSSVCSRAWGYPEAQVVCRQLGYANPSTAQPTQKGYFGPAGDDQYFFFVTNVTCVGTESTVSDCKQTSWGNLDACSSKDIAGALCVAPTGSGSTSASVLTKAYSTDSCADWDTRINGTLFANGTWAGRLDVCMNNVWGTVCRRLWDDSDAVVACRALGFTNGTALKIPEYDFFRTNAWDIAQPSMPIWLADLSCTGTETALSACNQRVPVGYTNCTHGMDAGIICSNDALASRYNDTAQCTMLGDIRLVPVGDTPGPLDAGASAVGRVEICYNRRWGTVCADSYWSAEDAEVLCRHLGFNYFFVNSTADTGSLPVWASYAQCTGNEDKFFKCQMWGLREVTDCTSGTRGMIACSNTPMTAAPPPASPYACTTTGALRLAPNDTSTNTTMYNDTATGIAGGRLEFCYNGQWGTLCTEYWSTAEARVACRQLGGGLEWGGVAANGTYSFAPSSQPVWLSISNCTGSETSLAECARYSNYNSSNINTTTLYPGQLGVLSLESTLYGGKTVCQSHRADLGIWCSKTFLSPPPPPTPPPLPPMPPPPAGDSCTSVEEGNLRLVTGNGTGYVYGSSSGQSQTGFLQVCHSSTWGRVCIARFGTEEAHVACRQLGFAGGIKMSYTSTNPPYLWGSAQIGPAWLDGLICSGTEAMLTNCYFKGWGNLVDSCPLQQGAEMNTDLVVQCLMSVSSPPPPSPPVPPVATYGCDTQGAVRLVDKTGTVVDTSSAATVEGAVHVCLNSSWSYVCDYLFSSNYAATVVCKQLGFGGGAPYSWTQLAARGYNNSRVQPAGMPRGPSWLQLCYGDEPTLLDCDQWAANDVTNCATTNSIAGVSCMRQAPPPSPPSPPPSPPYWTMSTCSRNFDLRFTEGPNPSSGRLEVCYNGTWGLICARGWDDGMSNIVCRQALGSSSAVGEAMIDWDGVASGTSITAISNTTTPNGTYPRFTYPPANYSYLLDAGLIRPLCTGNENRLSECVPVEAFGKVTSTCGRFSEVGVVCFASADNKVKVAATTSADSPYSCAGTTNGTVRLVNGTSPGMGRVEVREGLVLLVR
ncbi:hypothetical protein HYH02_006365 [Chlamydomonas schloesseri]|uniref:SRCR domain-containing protein n=1 Tax=Chlamydomonas schloesseri TaxID=2026947 RepID=A0A835WJJ9_9CHLO|nr:hypothetical protein HYH02_006365 [Chlamydomonas schloesseri]|eukprot:KAG2448473.1 hypothetical protein HYH02_006365 [Chlamydomonas schloesseri]